MADVVLQGVGKRFGEVDAIRDLSLTIKDGEFVVLLGPTGAGKTTTLRAVAGLEAPDAGTIAIDGRDVTGAAPAERDVAFVFQQYSLYPHLSVFDNLAFPLRAPGRRWGEREIRAKVGEIAGLLRIEHKLENKATQLSGGEMQRVAIGRALVRRPAVFLMDEPLSSLDAKLREDLRVEIKRIQLDLAATVLYVTHDQIEALTLADRIGVLREGTLVQVGTPHEIYGKPNSVYVAQRLGSPPINLLPVGRLGLPRGPAAAERVGLRPEDVHLGGGGRAAEILAVEHLGAETVVLLDAEGERLHALVQGGGRYSVGARTTLGLPPQRLLYFDGEGRRLDWESESGETAEGWKVYGG